MKGARIAFFVGGAVELVAIAAMFSFGKLGWDLAAKVSAFVVVLGFSVAYVLAPFVLAEAVFEARNDEDLPK